MAKFFQFKALRCKGFDQPDIAQDFPKVTILPIHNPILLVLNLTDFVEVLPFKKKIRDKNKNSYETYFPVYTGDCNYRKYTSQDAGEKMDSEVANDISDAVYATI